jgi:site-specific recombinase XerD
VLELSDAQFVLYVSQLRGPTERGTRPTQRTVIGNGRVTLDFLAYVDKFYGGINLVGDKCRIKAKRKIATSSHRGKSVHREIWDHPALGSPSPVRRRAPIDKNTIEALYKAVADLSTSNYLIHRRQLMIRVLEITGARIGEVALLKVGDVKQAFRSTRRLLTFYTLKRRSEHKREIPVLKQDLADLDNFIEIFRKPVVRKTIGRDADHGYLFISERTGSPLTAATLSNEVGMLRRHSGITTRASAHLFRHRFITRLLIHLIEEHRFQKGDDLRAALLEVESFKKVIMEWTGHASIESIEPYIDLAFAEWRGITNTVKAVIARRATEAFTDQVDRLVDGLGQKLTAEEFRASYEAIRINLKDDLTSNAP